MVKSCCHRIRQRRRRRTENSLVLTITLGAFCWLSSSIAKGSGAREAMGFQKPSSMMLAMFATALSSPTSSSAAASTARSSTARRSQRIAVIGGGASGIFAAISAASTLSQQQYKSKSVTKIVVLEATSSTLQKVKISGGGRCNVLHDTSKPTSTLLAGYPRGKKELQGLFHKHFTPTMAREWFESRGVALKTEEDGRMFPVTDSSQTIMDTILEAARQEGVEIQTKQKVVSIQPLHDGFELQMKQQDQKELYDAVILATGSSPSGYALLQQLDEQPMDPTVPSLFTLNAKTEIKEGGLLFGLSGISVPRARATLELPPNDDNDDGPSSKKRNKKKHFPFQEGPLLITHHGLSGPAVLRLSAFAAHEFKEMNYRGNLQVHWDIPLGDNLETLTEELWKLTTLNPKRTVASVCPLTNNNIPRRLWSSLVEYSGIPDDMVWGNISKKLVRKLATNIIACPVEVTGKGTFKDEFVTAGGVSLKYIDMKRMESKVYPKLFFCGELLNVDGVTGGYNFMNCWSTGYVAGQSAAESCINPSSAALTADGSVGRR